MASSQIPLCPLMMAGNEMQIVCAQERCALYMKNYKTCSIYILAHDAAINIKEKQSKKGV